MSDTGGYLISKVLLLSASAADAAADADARSILLAVLSVIVLLRSDSAVRERGEQLALASTEAAATAAAVWQCNLTFCPISYNLVLSLLASAKCCC